MLRLNRQSQLTRGLVFAVFPGGDRRHELIGGGLGVTNDVNSKWNTLWNTTDQYTAPGGGYVIDNRGGDTTRFYWPWSGAITTVTTECTIMAWVLFTGISNNFAHIFNFPYRTDGSWSTPFISMSLQRSGSTSSMAFNSANAGATNGVASDTGMLAADGIFNLLTATRSGTSVIFYKNGLQHGAAKTLGSGNATDWGSHAPPTLMNRAHNSNGESASGFCFFLGLWNRVLSPDEIYRFYINPFRILVPKGAIF